MKLMNMVFIASMVALLFVAPAMAFLDTDNSVNQNANGVVAGIGNTQTIQNSDGYINGDGNVQNVNTVNADSVSYSNTATSQSGTYINVVNEAPEYTYHDRLDIGTVNTEIVSLFMGEVEVVGAKDERWLQAGEQYKMTYKSACPLLAYVVDGNYKDRVRLWDGAPSYDVVYQKFDHNGISVTKLVKNNLQTSDRERLSTQREVQFVAPEAGTYWFVFDTRPAIHKNGQLIGMNDILDSTCDITYSIEAMEYVHVPGEFRPDMIGTRDMYPSDSYGRIVHD
jgi:hypothetical protein